MKRLTWLAVLLGLIGLPLLVQAQDAPAAKQKVLFFTRSQGFQHGPVERKGGQPASGEKWLTEFGAQNGFEVTCTKDGSTLTAEGLAGYDVLVMYTTGDLTAPGGKDSSVAMSKDGRDLIRNFVASGKGLIGIHSATDTFHSSKGKIDPFIRLIGAEFAGHGAMQNATQKVVEPTFPGFSTLGDSFVAFDEWYTFKDYAADMQALLLQQTDGMKGKMYEGKPAFPSTWIRQEGQGRVFYTSLGHDQKAMNGPVFAKVFLAGLNWAAGVTKFEVKPNLAQVAPGLKLAPGQ